MHRFLRIFILLLALAACNQTKPNNTNQPSVLPARKLTDHFPTIIDEAALNEAMNPCQDFYQFACGIWLSETVIPVDKKSVNRQMTPMLDAVDAKLNKILENYTQGDFSVPSTYATKLANVYTSCLTSEENSKVAINLAKEQIEKIKNTKVSNNFAKLIADLNLQGTSLFFRFNSMQDFNNSEHVIGDISQGGMALENPDYYLNQDDKAVEIRNTYKSYIAHLFNLLGESNENAKKIADTVLQMETTLASKAYSVTDQSNPDKINHLIGLSGLKTISPHFDWDIYFQTLGLSTLELNENLNVEEPEFFKNLDLFLQQTNKIDLDHYLTWLWINKIADKMGGEFEKAHFAFWSTYLNGAKEMKPRWQHCTQFIEQSMGYALAEAYVKLFNGKAIKEKTESMIGTIKSAFVNSLDLLVYGFSAWIDEDTLKGALEKVTNMEQKIGAPVKFRNYDTLVTTSNNFLTNSLNISKFETFRDLAKIGRPVDKSIWDMMPWEVNAYYDRSNNEFVFPFGILQPPSLDLAASDGANFGSFGGGTIGHELIHGFDNNGSKYDSHGNLKNWWTPKTQSHFNKKSQCYVVQANQYKIESVNLYVNGEQTLEENLADQGGVKLGYLALDRVLSNKPPTTAWLGKYSERQQYWIAYAQSWCTKSTPESLRTQMTSDVHPPAEFRVNAVIMNRPEFAHDFKCKINSKMAPANKCNLW